MKHNEYFKECLSKASVAILIFEVDSPEPVFIDFQKKDEYFDEDTWMLIPDGNVGMCGTFTDEDIDKANIVYVEDADEFQIAFANQDELFDEGFEHFKRIQFLYTKKALA